MKEPTVAGRCAVVPVPVPAGPARARSAGAARPAAAPGLGRGQLAEVVAGWPCRCRPVPPVPPVPPCRWSRRSCRRPASPRLRRHVGVAEDQDRAGLPADDGLHRVGRRRAGAGLVEERIRPGDRDDLVEDRRQRHAVDVADAVFWALFWAPGAVSVAAGAAGAAGPAGAAGAARAARPVVPPAGAGGAPNWPAAAIGAMPDLQELVELVLEGDDDLRIRLVGGLPRWRRSRVVPNARLAAITRSCWPGGPGRRRRGGWSTYWNPAKIESVVAAWFEAKAVDRPCRWSRRSRRCRRCRRCRRSRRGPVPTEGVMNGAKTLIGLSVAWGTNWAMMPATGVPWPSWFRVSDGARGAAVAVARAARVARAAGAAGAAVPVVLADGRRIVLVAGAAGDGGAGPGGDAAPEAGVGGVDAGVDDVHGAVLAVVGDAQGPQVVQADDRARTTSRRGWRWS